LHSQLPHRHENEKSGKYFEKIKKYLAILLRLVKEYFFAMSWISECATRCEAVSAHAIIDIQIRLKKWG